MQVEPVAQTVEPVYPVPPHCPYFATGVPVAVATEDEVVVLDLTVVLVWSVVELDDAGFDVEVGLVAAADDDITIPPGPATLVVKLPLSM